MFFSFFFLPYSIFGEFIKEEEGQKRKEIKRKKNGEGGKKKEPLATYQTAWKRIRQGNKKEKKREKEGRKNDDDVGQGEERKMGV